MLVSRRVEAKLELLGERAMEGGALQESHGVQLYLLSSRGMKSGGEMILFRAWHILIFPPDNEEVNALGKVVFVCLIDRTVNCRIRKTNKLVLNSLELLTTIALNEHAPPCQYNIKLWNPSTPQVSLS